MAVRAGVVARAAATAHRDRNSIQGENPGVNGALSLSKELTVRLSTLIIVFLAVASATIPLTSEAQPMGPGWRHFESYEGMPYGQYCPGMGRGPYGARKMVKTADEAKRIIEAYFSNSGQAVQVGNIGERKWFYFAEVTNSEGKIIDKLIVDKRSGRIRSIY